MFGNIGLPELIIIFAIALLIFGPKKLPEVGRSIGKALREFRRTSDELKSRIEEEIQAEELKEVKKGIEEIKEDLKEVSDIKGHFFSDEYPQDEAAKDKQQKPLKDSEKNEEGKKVS